LCRNRRPRQETDERSEKHTRWIPHYTAELEKRVRSQLNPTHASWRVAETHIEVRGAVPTAAPRVINGAGNAAYPAALPALQGEGELAPACELRPMKYRNNIVEQDHRFIKRRVKPG